MDVAMDAIVKVLSLGFANPPYDSFVFVGLVTLYVWFLSAAYHKPLQVTYEKPYDAKSLKNYVRFAALLGLLLPLVFLSMGFLLEAPLNLWGWKTAGPHLFLVAAQVASERFGGQFKLSTPVWTLIPPLYNGRRLFTIYQWMMDASVMPPVSSESAAYHTCIVWWIQFNQILAVANLLFWTYNLFAFLLPVFLPDFYRAHFLRHPDWPRPNVFRLGKEMNELVTQAQEESQKSK